jgi:hypothetical protein
MILAYETYRPRFAKEVKAKIIQSNKESIIALFNKIVDRSNFLTKIYKGSEMVSTFDELINFLEKANDKENVGVGITAYSVAIIEFRKKLNQTQKNELQSVIRKENLHESLEVTDKSITFEVDSLVSEKGDIKKLIQILKNVNAKNKISSFSSGITFNLRDI